MPISPLNLLRPAGGELPTPVVHTALGPVRGFAKGGVRQFRGIPFAAPPLGPLRFLPPQPIAPWAEVLDCTRFRPSALQGNPGEATIRHSEDCLHLNIWAPEEGEGLPVLVFIHGGGFSDGSPAQRTLDGTAFAKSGVVQVNIGYRLGALGFMAFPEVAAEYGSLGNLGLLDQIAALRWVRENIAAFGGNAANVTLCGESAGAFSVSCLMLSPLAKGLFRRCILESGNLLGQPIVSPRAPGGAEEAVSASLRYMRSFGARSLPALREVSGRRLAAGAAFRANMTAPPVYNFWPVLDGHVLPKDPFAALAAGQVNGEAMLAGFNSDEGTLFIPPTTGEEAYTQLVYNIFGTRAWQVLERYPATKRRPAAARARDLVKMGLRIGTDLFADALSEARLPVYYYNFSYAVPALEAAGLGAMHALELPFVFATVPAPLLASEALRALVAHTHGAWLGFIREGEPALAGRRAWPRYSAAARDMLVLAPVPRAAKLPGATDVEFFKVMLYG